MTNALSVLPVGPRTCRNHSFSSSLARGSIGGTMSNTNELIAQIDSARAGGTTVKQIRRQKFDPNNFYMTLSDGKQVGPVKVEGNSDELNRKFGEAVSYMNAMKNAPKRATTAA